MMEFAEITGFLWKCGYSDYETKEKHKTFYEFDRMDFLYADCAKKFDFDYDDGKVGKIVMTQYSHGKTTFKDITTIEELYDSI